MTATLAPGAILTDPQIEATHYGIPVVSYGEDGDMLALGHHEPRKALAAFNRLARSYGLHNVADDRSALVQDWIGEITQTWLVFRTPDPAQGDEPGYVWFAGAADASTPGALPVTLLNVS